MDTGKSDPLSKAWRAGHEFEEHQLKQLRAQCIVFLAFKNGLDPKKPHLEIALGNISSKQDGTERDVSEQVVPGSSKAHSSKEPDERISRKMETTQHDTTCLAMLELCICRKIRKMVRIWIR